MLLDYQHALPNSLGASDFPVLVMALLLCLTVSSKGDPKSLEEIERFLQEFPPSLGLDQRTYEGRRVVAEALDEIISISVNQKTSEKGFEELAPLAEFYHRQVNRGLDELEGMTVTDGVVICKLYSSSVLVKSAEGTIIIDFQEGPVRANEADPAECDPLSLKAGFLWSSRQLDRLAEMVDVSFISHIHPDHASFALSRRLIERGKPVVVTPQLKEFWRSLRHGLIVPDYRVAQRIGPAEFMATLGHQYMQKTSKDAQGLEVGERSVTPGTDAETNIYLVKTGGITFFHAAENNDVIDEWLSVSALGGYKPDVILSTGMRQGGRATEIFLARQQPFLRLPIHEYEMTHPNGGNRTLGIFQGRGKEELKSGRRAFLFWGETLVLPGTEKLANSDP